MQFIEADLFEWQPTRRYDTVFFAFSLSHVPPTRLPDFWSTVAAALAPGGKAVFIDDGPAVAASEEVLANQPTPAVLRRLEDGSQYRIVKVFHDAQTLTDVLTALEWSVDIRPMGGNFIGIAEPPTTPGEEPAAGRHKPPGACERQAALVRGRPQRLWRSLRTQGAFSALGGQDVGVAGVDVAPARVFLHLAGQNGMVRVVRVRHDEGT